MNVCRGDFLYDVARTVLLVKYKPATEVGERRMLLRLKKH